MPTAKDLAKRLLPRSFVQRRQREKIERSWTPQPHEIDLSRAQLLRDAPAERLTDAGWLEESLLPRLGFNPEHPEQFPRALDPYVGGLKHWQYPSQFSRYLALVARYPVRSYVEIGTRHGGTFVITCEYLSRFRPMEWALGVDLYPVPALERYAAERPFVESRAANSRSPRFKRSLRRKTIDLALVDGDHSEEGCWSDTMLMHGRTNIIVLHDIVNELVPGVPACWQRLRREHADTYRFHEFTQQYDDVLERLGHPVLGLGVAVRRDFAEAS